MGGAAEGISTIEKGTEEFGRIQDLNRSNARNTMPKSWASIVTLLLRKL